MTDTDGLTRLSQLADDLYDAEADVAQLSADLKAAQGDVKTLTEFTIPELMDTLEMAAFTTKAGDSITVQDKLSAKKLTQRHGPALDWLRANSQGGLIKTVVGVPFTAGSEADADELVEQLSGEGLAAIKSMEVHHSSLAAAIKQMMKDGVDVPMELLGGYQRRVATVVKKRK